MPYSSLAYYSLRSKVNSFVSENLKYFIRNGECQNQQINCSKIRQRSRNKSHEESQLKSLFAGHSCEKTYIISREHFFHPCELMELYIYFSSLGPLSCLKVQNYFPFAQSTEDKDIFAYSMEFNLWRHIPNCLGVKSHVTVLV